MTQIRRRLVKGEKEEEKEECTGTGEQVQWKR